MEAIRFPAVNQPDTRRRLHESSSESATRAWYAAYYEKQGADRNDLLTNPEVLFQTLAFDAANVRALRSLPIDRRSARVLDVGCGSGASLLQFIRLGFRAGNLAGVDINSERLGQAQLELPAIDLRCESAERMSFPAARFEVVFECTMFVQLTDERLARRIAQDMLRVTAEGGYIVLVDWRYSKPGNNHYRGVSKRRVETLFDVGGKTEIVSRVNGALVPPVGRWVSRHCPAFYFVIAAILPFAVGQVTTVLRKL